MRLDPSYQVLEWYQYYHLVDDQTFLYQRSDASQQTQLGSSISCAPVISVTQIESQWQDPPQVTLIISTSNSSFLLLVSQTLELAISYVSPFSDTWFEKTDSLRETFAIVWATEEALRLGVRPSQLKRQMTVPQTQYSQTRLSDLGQGHHPMGVRSFVQDYSRLKIWWYGLYLNPLSLKIEIHIRRFSRQCRDTKPNPALVQQYRIEKSNLTTCQDLWLVAAISCWRSTSHTKFPKAFFRYVYMPMMLAIKTSSITPSEIVSVDDRLKVVR